MKSSQLYLWLLPIVLGFALPLDGAVFHLRDGTELAGAYVTEEGDQVVVLLKGGQLQRVARDDILRVEWDREVNKILEARAQRERKRLHKKRQRRAGELVKKLGRATRKKPTDEQASERREILDELDRFTGPELAPALADAIVSKRAGQRDFAYQRLVRVGDRSAVVPLLRGALGSPDPQLRPRAHEAALAIDREASRKVYEYVVAASSHTPERLLALEYIQKIGDIQSVPRLIEILEYVDAQVRVQLVRTKRIKEVPVNLGTQGAAATEVPIELPEIELIGVAVGTKIPTKSLVLTRDAVVNTLHQLSHENHGTDGDAWRRWWKAHQSKVRRTGEEKERESGR